MKKICCIILSLMLLACSKQEIKLNSRNPPPQERPISLELKKNYLNRLFISLLGRKSLNSEQEKYLSILGDQAAPAQRKIILDSLMQQEEFAYTLFQNHSADILANVDTGELFTDLARMKRQLQQASGNFRRYLEGQIPRYQALADIFPALAADSLDLKDLHMRMVNTGYYDDINMGTENFVVSCFQNFFLRYPSKMELENASTMVNGNSAQLFLSAGTHKEDFIAIFFNSPEYFEGQIRYHYQRFLFREPSAYELHQESTTYYAEEDYRQMIQKILASDEYFFN